MVNLTRKEAKQNEERGRNSQKINVESQLTLDTYWICYLRGRQKDLSAGPVGSK